MALDDFISFILLFYFKTGKKLSEGELNSLIAHAHRRIEQLQHQLANHMAMEKERIQEALNIQQKADETVCDRRIQDEALKIKNSINLEKSKWVWMRKQTLRSFYICCICCKDFLMGSLTKMPYVVCGGFFHWHLRN